MAQDDFKIKRGGGASAAAAQKARDSEAELSEQASNIAVGDFLSELATAIRFRMKLGQPEGDWIEEPERYYTDGQLFAVEEAVASQVKLQLTVTMDASTSMWANNIMRFAGPTFVALDNIIRKAMADLPEGAVHYAPFIFHEQAFKIPSNFVTSYTGRMEYTRGPDKEWRNEHENSFPLWVPWQTWYEAQQRGELPKDLKHGERKKVLIEVDLKGGGKTMRNQEMYVPTMPLSGPDTRIAPLFRAIKDWEERDSDPSAVRLDIVITDGVFKHQQDVLEASRVQMSRGGRGRTILLNFMPLDQWSNYPLPEQCSMFAVTAANLDTSIRNILTETIADMLG